MLLFSAKFVQDKPNYLAYGWWSIENYPQFFDEYDPWSSRLYLCQEKMSELFPIPDCCDKVKSLLTMTVSLYDEQNSDNTRIPVSLLNEENEDDDYDYWTHLRVVTNKTHIVHTCSEIVQLIEHYIFGGDYTRVYVEVSYD